MFLVQDDHHAEFIINKRKLGVYKGAINKIMGKIDEIESLRTTAEKEGSTLDLNLHISLVKSAKTIAIALPAVEVSNRELRAQVRASKLADAKLELKNLQDAKHTKGLSDEEKKAIAQQKIKISTEKAATKVMKIVHNHRRRTMEQANASEEAKERARKGVQELEAKNAA